MGRFTVVDAPALQPAVDYVTSSAVGPFIDTGRDIDFQGRKIGRIYLSADTVREMASELGIISGGAAEEALQNAYITGKLDGLRETIGGDLYRVVDTLDRWLAVLRPHLAAAETAETH